MIIVASYMYIHKIIMYYMHEPLSSVSLDSREHKSNSPLISTGRETRGGKFLNIAHTKMIWLTRCAIFKEITPFSMVKIFKHPIAHSTSIHKDAMDLPCCTSLADSCCLPSRKGGMFNAGSISTG